MLGKVGNRLSIKTLWIVGLIMFSIHTFYYPKYLKDGPEATIGWDVAGYYTYLPAVFIYQDISNISFEKEILDKYNPNPGGLQALPHDASGKKVIKYSCGLAVVYSPFFFIAHAFASFTTYPADGFSLPYQFMISFGSLFIAFLGLYYLRKFLLLFFTEIEVSLTLLSIVMASNYLDYAVINTAMSHNYLFTIYSIMLYATYQFYKRTVWQNAIIIGFLSGLAALIRPTDILIIIIPILWNINIFSLKSIKERIQLFYQNWKSLLLAVIVCLSVGSLQLIYWKYVTGEWIVYSYGDEGFSWLRPHIIDGLFSYKTGWLLYSPIFIFALIGWVVTLLSKKEWGHGIFIYFSFFTYVVLAWDNWWYGGGLGLRAMIQSYPVLALPMALFWKTALKQSLIRWLSIIILGTFVYYNLWLTHQAHKGGLLPPAQVTKAYFWSVLGRYEVDPEITKLLDTDEIYRGVPKSMELISKVDFENYPNKSQLVIEGENSCLLSKDIQFSPIIKIEKDSIKLGKWLRVKAEYYTPEKEWSFWRMPQITLKFRKGENLVKERFIRLSRFINHAEQKVVHMDIKVPMEKDFDRIEIQFWNAESTKIIVIDNVMVYTFDSQ
jgi:hypothetical protein